MEKTICRPIYLYLFALVGLLLITIGGVKIIELGLKTFILTQADADYYSYPAPVMTAELKMAYENASVTPDEKLKLTQMYNDYEQWKATTTRIDPRTAQHQRDLASALAMLLVGIPLYWYHWRTICRNRSEKC